MAEIVQCESCNILLLAGSEINVFGGIGAANSITFADMTVPREIVVIDPLNDPITRANFLYIIPSVKPEWCLPGNCNSEISYVFSRTNEYERD